MMASQAATRASWILPGLAVLVAVIAVMALTVGAFPLTLDGFFRAVSNVW